jgi:hypothetical protein
MPQPLVALQAALPQFADPADQQLKAYKLRELAAQADIADQARADDQASRAAYAANPTDGAARLSALAGVSPKAYAAEAKAQADQAKAGAETHAKQIETAHKQIDLAGQAFGYVRQFPTPENAKSAIKWLGDQGVYTPDQVAQYSAKVDADPNNVKTMADQAFAAALGVKEQLSKIETKDAGGSIVTQGTNPMTGQTTTLSTLAKTQSPDNVATNERIAKEGAANRANQIQVQKMIGERQDSRDVSVSHGVKGLTPEQNEALFGEKGAVTTGRLDPNRVNSKTASIFADAELKRPGTDFSKISGDIALGRNATFRQNAMTAEVLPEIMQQMVDAGKKIGFSDNRTIGKMQGWVKGEFNDPDMTEYMTQRNDALMTVARVMRGAGMTDMAHKAETEVSSPTMSPDALDAWMRGQMKSLQPRLDINRRITRDAPRDKTPPAGAHPADISDLLKKYGSK